MTKTSRPAFLWFRSDNRKSAIQNPKWLGLLIIALVLVVGGAVAEAQQPTKLPKIGFLGVHPDAANYSAKFVLLELQKLGYIEGKNFAFEYRSAKGN